MQSIFKALSFAFKNIDDIKIFFKGHMKQYLEQNVLYTVISLNKD